MTNAQYRNWRALIGQRVVIHWNDESDWHHFKVLAVDRADAVLQLQGVDDDQGNKHDGDVFWVDAHDIKFIQGAKHAA